MNTQYLRIFAEQFLVGLNGQGCECTVGIHLPCRITVTLYHFGTSELEHCLDGGSLVVKGTHHITALTGDDTYFAICCFHAGYVVGGFNQPCQFLILTHGEDTIINSLKSLDQFRTGCQRQDVLSFCTLHVELHGFLCNVVFLFNLGSEHIPVGTYLLLDIIGYTEYDDTVTRNGVVKLTAVEAGKSQSISFLRLVEEAGEYLDGVCAFLIDVVTGMTANKTL